MVRAQIKRLAEDKVTTRKRAVNGAKEKQRPGGKMELRSDSIREAASCWICKISGCNKKFVREADLKRHQRTSKLHMQPNSQPISCPQCNSTFTRNDALRRHQKSRHNGTMISPSSSPNNKSTEGEQESSTSARVTRSKSHSPGPSKDRKRNASPSPSDSASVPVHTMVIQPDAPGTSIGSQSYYRENFIQPVFLPARTPNGTLDSAYTQPSISMSTKFHAWVMTPSWTPDKSSTTRHSPGGKAHGQLSPSGYYPPGAYYRTPNGEPLLPSQNLPHGVVTMQVNPSVPSHANGITAGSGSTTSTLTEYNANIDPSLRENSTMTKPPEDETEETTPKENGQETDTFAGSGLSVDIQKVLKAVLAIDSETNAKGTAAQNSSVHPTAEKVSSSPHDSSAAASGLHATGIMPPFDQNGTIDDVEKDAMDLDADGDAESDGGETLQDVQLHDESRSEPSIPDGIRDLINEDSLSYASPS